MDLSKPSNQRAAASDSPAWIARNSSLKSRTARFVNSTRYAVLTAHLLEDLAGRPGPARPCIFQPLPDAFAGVGLRGNIQQALV